MEQHKQKAIELVKKMLPYVECHIGSATIMMMGDIDVALENARKCAHIVVDEVLEVADHILREREWQQVKLEIDKVTSNDIQ